MEQPYTVTLEGLGIIPGDCVAVVGAGGKTMLCWHIIKELVRRGESAVFTTTTRIWQPQPDAWRPATSRIIVSEDVEEVCLRLKSEFAGDKPSVTCIAASFDGPRNDSLVVESRMPVVYTKLKGFTGEQICYIRRAITNIQSPISLVVEADGARGLWLKAPGEHEPVIPPCATVVCVVANLRALRQPLDERVAHRPERVACLVGARIGEMITPQMLIDVLAHPDGGMKGIPARARRVVVLMRDGGTEVDAGRIISALKARGYDGVLVVRWGFGGVDDQISA